MILVSVWLKRAVKNRLVVTPIDVPRLNNLNKNNEKDLAPYAQLLSNVLLQMFYY